MALPLLQTQLWEGSPILADTDEAAAPTLAERASWVDVAPGDPTNLEVPRKAHTSYLTHGLFRYVGKLPPPLVAYLLNEYSRPGDLVLDPMCGGGTTAIEAATSDRRSVNFDVNPVARLATAVLARQQDLSNLQDFANRACSAPESVPPEALSAYFSPAAFGLLEYGLREAKEPVERLLCLSIARKASFANTKKINTVVDRTKSPVDARTLIQRQASEFIRAFRALASTRPGSVEVEEGRADQLPLKDDSVGFVLLHPPYLSNTAFSEVTHLQLLLLGVTPTKIRETELAYRGSYFHVPNGLQKYLIGWNRVLAEAARTLRPGGSIVVAVGDGRIERVRIPVGAITEQYARDLGLTLRLRAVHRLNNQTGWTLSRRMESQHILVFGKS